MKNNALISQKTQTYIEKDPIDPSKRLRAPRKRSSVSAFLSSPETMPLHPLHTNVHRESPHLFQNRLWPCAGRSQTRPVEDFGTDGGLYSNYPLYLGDVGHVSGTTSLRSPSCALRSV